MWSDLPALRYSPEAQAAEAELGESFELKKTVGKHTRANQFDAGVLEP